MNLGPEQAARPRPTSAAAAPAAPSKPVRVSVPARSSPPASSPDKSKGDMPFLIVSDRRGELDRRDLRDRKPVTIGRALDCDICVRDILLSRTHCRISPFDNGRWLVEDLGSKNGTRVGGETITRHVLREGDVIKIGKTQIAFVVGEYVAPPRKQRKPEARPADPFEAMAGTVAGFQLFDMEEDSRVSGFPIPRPKPADPASYRNDDVHALVTDIASSSWDLALSDPEFDLTKPQKKVPREIVERRREIAEKAKLPRPVGVLDSAAAEVAPPHREAHPTRRRAALVWLSNVLANVSRWLRYVGNETRMRS